MAGKQWRALKSSIQARMDEMVKSGLLWRDDYGHGDYWIRDCEWSDYSGSTYTRSNARSLARDYDVVVTACGSGSAYSSTGAYISKSVLNDGPCVGFPDICERVAAVLDIIDALSEYPVYDEEDMSAIEDEILAEDFDSWGRSDMERELNRAAGYPDDEIEVDEQRAREAFYMAAEGYGFTATGSDVSRHAERAVELYSSNVPSV